WSPEHHFLKNYSHQPAPEVYLSWVAARTKRIHVGTAIVNITAAVNHPARVAERIAVMDHLSEGRVEFGTGRGSSSAEWAGFAIPSAAETKPMWRESLEQIPRMWRDQPYSFEGKYFRMPERNVLPKPYSKPHPPIWVACSSPPTFIEAGELGLGSLCFTFGTPAEIAEHVRNYKAAIKRCKRPIGDYINDNIAVTTNMFCLEDGDRARGGRPSDRRARGDRAGDRDVRGARCGPAHLRALDPHPGPEVRARVDRDLRQARAPEVRHGPGAPHDAPARGGAQGAGGMSVPVCDHVLIGGEWVRAAGGTYPVIDPATEEPAGHAPECSVEQVRAAARAARAAFERGPWRTMS